MKLSFLQSIALAGLLGCCSGAHANPPVAARTPEKSSTPQVSTLPIRTAVVVKEVRGHVEYAYDSTGWKTLSSGKSLRPGATVRASADSTAVLRVTDHSSFYKVSALTQVRITSETPVEELAPARLTALSTKGTKLAAD
jgi:hypothetical protein